MLEEAQWEVGSQSFERHQVGEDKETLGWELFFCQCPEPSPAPATHPPPFPFVSTDRPSSPAKQDTETLIGTGDITA